MSRAAQSAETVIRSRDSRTDFAKDPSGRLAIQFGPEMIPRLQELCRPDGHVFTLWVLGHVGVFAVAFALIAYAHSVALKVVLSLLLANQLHAITVLQHDCGHGSAYKSSIANLWVGRFLAWFIFMPYTTFTVIHRRHHVYLGDPKKDPDEWFYAGGPLVAFLREVTFVPYFTLRSLIDFGRDVRWVVLRELVGLTTIWAAVAYWLLTHGRVALLMWGAVTPMALLALVINPISRGYEHYPMMTLKRGDRRREDIRFNTVTVTSRILGVLWANITYHVEHHLYPRVPCHRLLQLHHLLRGRDYIVAPFVLFPLEERPLSRSAEALAGIASRHPRLARPRREELRAEAVIADRCEDDATGQNRPEP